MSTDDVGSISVQGLAELDRKLESMSNAAAGKALFGAAMFALTPAVKEAKQRAAKAKEPHIMTMVNGATVNVQPGLLKSAIKKRRLPKSEHKGPYAQGAVVGVYIGKGRPQKVYPRYWHIIERGSVHQPATPFIRPAFDNNVNLMVTRFAEKLSDNIDKATHG